MASPSQPILEGVFAIEKPYGVTSAQVIRDVQKQFDPSKLFRPWIDREKTRRDVESQNQKKKRKWRGRREVSVKIGHGGTLDPMATGVLILGVGSGTKQLDHFTKDCNKSYEAVVLFGAATDTYDTVGKVVSRSGFDGVTREKVEGALQEFRGKIMQRPPLYSALKVQGKKLYEYAREGKEVPIEIQKRPVEVLSLEMLEWIPGETHEWHWPAAEAEPSEKEVIDHVRLLDPDDHATSVAAESPLPGKKRKREDAPAGEIEDVAESTATADSKRLKPEKDASEDLQQVDATEPVTVVSDIQSRSDGESGEPTLGSETTVPPPRGKCPAPACRLRMTVTSGFYVRSLCHDLGMTVGSLGIMASLVRLRQGEFVLGENTLCYDDLNQGEDVWGPKVQELLESGKQQDGQNKD